MPIGTKIKGFARLAVASLTWIAVRPVTKVLSITEIIISLPGRACGRIADACSDKNLTVLEIFFSFIDYILKIPTVIPKGVHFVIDKIFSPIIGHDNLLDKTYRREMRELIETMKVDTEKVETPSWFVKGKFEISTGADYDQKLQRSKQVDDLEVRDDTQITQDKEESIIKKDTKSEEGTKSKEDNINYRTAFIGLKRDFKAAKKVGTQFGNASLYCRYLNKLEDILLDCDTYIAAEGDIEKLAAFREQVYEHMKIVEGNAVEYEANHKEESESRGNTLENLEFGNLAQEYRRAIDKEAAQRDSDSKEGMQRY